MIVLANINKASPRSSLSKRLLFYSLALTSALFSASFVVLDTYISIHVLPDPYLFAQMSWITGSILIILMIIIFSIPMRSIGKQHIPIGSFLDPNFKSLHIPDWDVLKYVLLGGAFMSFSTLFYFKMIEKFDASTFVPLMSFVIIYLIIGDFIIEKDNPTIIEIQAIIAIIAGIFISSLSQGEFDLESVIITLVIMNGLAAGVTISHKKATQWVDPETKKPLDSITIRLYSVLIATVINTIIFVFITDLEQKLIFKQEFWNSFLPVTVSMALATLSYILFIRALRMGKMSIVNSLRSFSVIIAIPLTMIANYLYPQYVPFNFGGTTGIILKSIGAVLVLVGMISLALSDVRVLALIKVSENGLSEIDNIANLKGVTRVSVLAGKYDMLVTIRTRSIGKGYRQTIRKIKEISTIKEVITTTILKEWN